ncbi:protein tramtrack, beta isoform isoform X4 [Colias croceus]|uniref:protein tramtrack, beta isoform isoform X4 n=1 Tax=Colias crocea TaxID=72248 RepID=UPI001E27F8D5|nr:protein tramtrack, beta isoform isoform X4 [Colias croceus]
MASDEQFSLCWNNFHANMSAGFHGLLSRGDLVDVTLAAEGRLLQAHKLVLSVCSPYFQEMFKMNPTQHPIVFLKDVSHSALRDLLQFMYQGEVNVKQEELATFISTAEQLQVKGLTGNQNEESSTPSKPKPTSRPGPRSSQQRQSVMTKIETELDSKPSSTPVAIKRTNRPSIASNNSSSSQSGPAKRKCVDPLEAGPSGSAKEEFVTIPDEDENNAVAPKMEPEFVNESMWDEDEDGANNDETNFGEDDSNMEMSGFDGSATGDGTIAGGGEGGAVGDAQDKPIFTTSRRGKPAIQMGEYRFNKKSGSKGPKGRWVCTKVAMGYAPIFTTSRHGKPAIQMGAYRYNKWSGSKGPKGRWVCTRIANGYEPIFTTSRMGKPAIQMGKYRYNKWSGSKGPKGRWMCNRVAKGCKARIITMDNVLVSFVYEHNH